MFGRGSPKINLMEVASVQRKSSPRSGGKRKKRSPKGSDSGQREGTEEGFQGAQGGKQSGVHWDDKFCMIMAEPPILDNIIVSHPKASKFQRQGFPLYDDLEKLYDGKTAEGNLAFISIEPKESDDVRIRQPPMEQVTCDRSVGSLAFISGYDDHQNSDDDDVRICVATSSRTDASMSSRDKRVAVERDEEHVASRSRTKRKQNGDVAEITGTEPLPLMVLAN